jgi:hypothetical protein
MTPQQTPQSNQLHRVHSSGAMSGAQTPSGPQYQGQPPPPQQQERAPGAYQDQPTPTQQLLLNTAGSQKPAANAPSTAGTQLGGAGSSGLPSGGHSSSSTKQMDARFVQLRPAVLPKEMFEDLERHSVDVLCSIGKEITQDLMARALNFMSVMKLQVTNNGRNAAVDVETVVGYCRWLFERLIEVGGSRVMPMDSQNNFLKIPRSASSSTGSARQRPNSTAPPGSTHTPTTSCSPSSPTRLRHQWTPGRSS